MILKYRDADLYRDGFERKQIIMKTGNGENQFLS